MAVVNAVTARHPVEVYRFLTEELGSHGAQWLPCVEPKTFRTIGPGRWNAAEMPIMGTVAARPGHSTSVVTHWSVDPDYWRVSLPDVDFWRKDGMGQVRLNWFDLVVDQWMGRMPRICVFAEVCGRSLAIEKDGSIYACDHFVYPEYRRGNLAGRSRGDAEGDSPIFVDANLRDSPRLPTWFYSPEARRFGWQRARHAAGLLQRCPYRFACNGGCMKDRFIKTPDGEPGLNYLCPGFRRFLAYADPHLRQIAADRRDLPSKIRLSRRTKAAHFRGEAVNLLITRRWPTTIRKGRETHHARRVVVRFTHPTKTHNPARATLPRPCCEAPPIESDFSGNREPVWVLYRTRPDCTLARSASEGCNIAPRLRFGLARARRENVPFSGGERYSLRGRPRTCRNRDKC